MSEREDTLRQVQASLQAGRFDEGYSAAVGLLNADPRDGEALYMAAVAARYLKRFDDAEDWLRSLHQVMPEYGRAWQEQGHLALAQGDNASAIDAFERATRFNPALEVSWRELARLHSEAGRIAEAQAAAAQQQRLRDMPRELLAVTNHLAEGRLLRAEEICRHYMRQNPRDTEGMRLLAKIGIELGVLEDAEFLLESAVEFSPEDIQLRLDYIDVLRRRQKFEPAREEAEALLQRAPDNPVFQSRLAIECIQTGEYDRALDLFDAVLRKIAGDPASLTSRGHALKTKGARSDAEASYRAAIATRPDHGDAWYALANLKTYRFSDAEVAAMQEQAERGDLAFMDRVHLNFALAKAMEDEGDYEASFGFYNEGNALKRAQTRYSAETMSAELAKQREHCAAELFDRHKGSGNRAPDPIFILGLPHAGSTLLEQILASHSQIDGTLELPNILALAHRLRGRKAGQSRYPKCSTI